MNDDCTDNKIRFCPENKPPRPINLQADPPPDDSGFLIVRFKVGTLGAKQLELPAAAKEAASTHCSRRCQIVPEQMHARRLNAHERQRNVVMGTV